jgi:hypothetical protein
MYDIEHPDITFVNRTGYTREQWREMERTESEDEHEEE